MSGWGVNVWGGGGGREGYVNYRGGGMGAGMRGGLVVGVEARPPLTLCEVQGWLEKQQPFVLQVPHPHPHLDPCEAANFNSINYFSTQDFGINIQSSIFQHNNCEYKNDRVFFNTTILNIKNDRVFFNANF